MNKITRIDNSITLFKKAQRDPTYSTNSFPNPKGYKFPQSRTSDLNRGRYLIIF